jgi:hypothetical protein
MKTFANKFYFLLLCLTITITITITITTTAFSQNYLKSYQTVENELKSDLDYLFQHLDKSKITSGLLSNYALELTELAPYSGVLSDTNDVNKLLFISKISIL